MLEDFLNMRLAVYLDKNNPSEIRKFYNLIEPYTEDIMPPSTWRTVGAIGYFLDQVSGPYHIVDPYGKIFNGGTRRWAVDNNIKIITASEFIKIMPEEILIDITEDDLINIFN